MLQTHCQLVAQRPIMQTAEMKSRMTEDGIVAVGSSREKFAAHIKSEIAKWAHVIKQSGARID